MNVNPETLNLAQPQAPNPIPPKLSPIGNNDSVTNIGALVIRIGFWGPLYPNFNKEPPKNSIGNYGGPYIESFLYPL